MRIVQIGPYPIERGKVCGGVEASVFGLSQGQSNIHEVHVFDVPRIGGRSAVDKDGLVMVHRFCNTGKRQYQTAHQIAAMAKEICSLCPDVCHIHGTGLFSWLMFKALRAEGQKVVVTVHGLVRVEKRNQLKKHFTAKTLFQCLYQGWVEKRFLEQLSLAVADTEYVRDMVNRYPIRKKPVMHVVPQGINEDFFSMRCSADSCVLLSVGAIGSRKGHLLTLQAFERLRETGVDARLVIVGTIADQTYLEQLESALSISKYKDGVRLYTNLSSENLKQLYKEAHLFVLHSEEESQGIVFAEAMATGLPIVATRVGGIPYVVMDGENGLLTEYGDVKAFADAMACLMTDGNRWLGMSEISRKLAQDYHWSAISEKMMRVYHSVVEINKRTEELQLC